MSDLPLNEGVLNEFARQIQLIGGHVLEGLHISKRSGSGVEYHSTSPYTQGDDLRKLDWKRLASSDRLFVQRAEREERANWQIFYDYSSSMKYGDKTSYAQKFCGSLCFLAESFKDRWRINDLNRTSLIEAFDFLLHPHHSFDLKALKSIHLSSDSIFVFISDFFFDLESLRLLKSFDERVRFHFIQILDEKELEFSFENVIQFRDLESSQKLTLDTNIVKQKYLKALMDHQSKLRGMIPRANFMQVLANPDKVETDLLNFFEAM